MVGSGREKHLGMAPGDWEQLALRKQLRGGNGLRHPGWRATIPGGNGRAGDAPGMCRRSQLGLWDKSPPLEGFCGVWIPPGAVLEGRQGFPRGIFWSFPANPGKFWLLAPIRALCSPPELGCYEFPPFLIPRNPLGSWLQRFLGRAWSSLVRGIKDFMELRQDRHSPARAHPTRWERNPGNGPTDPN